MARVKSDLPEHSKFIGISSQSGDHHQKEFQAITPEKEYETVPESDSAQKVSVINLQWQKNVFPNNRENQHSLKREFLQGHRLQEERIGRATLCLIGRRLIFHFYLLGTTRVSRSHDTPTVLSYFLLFYFTDIPSRPGTPQSCVIKVALKL